MAGPGPGPDGESLGDALAAVSVPQEATAGVGRDPGGAAAPAAVGPARGRRDRAWELVEKLWRRGVRWRVGPDGRACWFLPTAGIDPPTPLAEAVMEELAAEVRAELRIRGVPIPADDRAVEGPGPAPAEGPGPVARPAPKVREPARVRSLIARLAVDPDDRDLPLAVARSLSEAFGDHKPESRETFLGLAGDVQRGSLAVGCLLEAFDEASRGKKWNRGAAFVHAVKRWKFAARRSTAPPPGPGARASHAGGAP